MEPQLELAGARAAHQVLLAGIADLTDADIGRASLLPGWTIGHVLTHLARNADSHRGMFLAAQHGAVADQYPGGVAQRAADIEAGAARPAAALVADVRESLELLEATWAATDLAAWTFGRGRTGTAGERSLPDLVFRRWRETEVHHADLGRAFGWADWSDDYVDRELDHGVAGLAARLAPGSAVRIEADGVIGAWIVETGPAARTLVRGTRHELAAWLLGRAPRPDWPALGPW